MVALRRSAAAARLDHRSSSPPTRTCTTSAGRTASRCTSRGELVGGVYGVGIGRFFAGESMFHRATRRVEGRARRARRHARAPAARRCSTCSGPRHHLALARSRSTCPAPSTCAASPTPSDESGVRSPPPPCSRSDRVPATAAPRRRPAALALLESSPEPGDGRTVRGLDLPRPLGHDRSVVRVRRRALALDDQRPRGPDRCRAVRAAYFDDARPRRVLHAVRRWRGGARRCRRRPPTTASSGRSTAAAPAPTPSLVVADAEHRADQPGRHRPVRHRLRRAPPGPAGGPRTSGRATSARLGRGAAARPDRARDRPHARPAPLAPRPRQRRVHRARST